MRCWGKSADPKPGEGGGWERMAKGLIPWARGAQGLVNIDHSQKGMGWERAPLHFLTGLRPLQAQGPPKFKVSDWRGRMRQGRVPLPCIGCGRGRGSYIQSQQPPRLHTSNAAKHWCEEGGLGASSSKTFPPPAHHPLIALERKLSFHGTLTLLKPGEAGGGPPPPPRPA